MRVRVFLALAVLGVVVGVVGAPPAGACSCVGRSEDEAFARADVVFVGDVAEVARSASPVGGGQAIWTFSVQEVLKGDAAQHQPVVTAEQSTACGLDLPRQGRALIFATRTPPGEAPVLEGSALFSGLCSGSRAWTGEAGTGSTVDTHTTGPLGVALGSSHPPQPDAVGPSDHRGWRALGLAALMAGSVVLVRRVRRAP